MNIREAKEEIKKAVLAYTAKTEAGTFKIPVKWQRPLLLIGPPGIGKTAVMEQIARECGIGLVAYTMTHHTRQSAIGLPVLEEKEFAGERCTVTVYTMSEILAAVYEQIERSGCPEGILFLDEINCVSETLMPAMLQFLQYKTFGNHRLPEGWVIVAAGNPPAYNRSVREFDTVTLDRVRLIEVEPDRQVWKEYAVARRLHPAVLSFLELRPERFYVAEPGSAGIVTGRAWEDLSEILLTMEECGLAVEETLFGQYLQQEETALEFAFYYRIYEKWKGRLEPGRILEDSRFTPKEGEEIPGQKTMEEGQGTFPQEAVDGLKALPTLPFDERLCIVWLLLRSILDLGAAFEEQRKLTDSLKYFAEGLTQSGPRLQSQIEERLEGRKKGFAVRKQNGLLAPGEEEREQKLARIIRACMEEARLSGNSVVFKERCAQMEGETKGQQEKLVLGMKNASSFIRRTFGEGQELVIFLTGLTEHPACANVLKKEIPELWDGAQKLLNADSREEELRRRLQG